MGVVKSNLNEQDRVRLDSIVQKMQENNEPEENIRLVVDDFKQKYSPKKKDTLGITASGSASVGSKESVSESGSQIIEYDKLYKRGSKGNLRANIKSLGYDQEKQLDNISAKLYLGEVKGDDLLKLKKVEGGDKVFEGIVKEYLGEDASAYGYDPEVFGSEKKIAELEKAIQIKNRPQAVVAKQNYLADLKKELPTVSKSYDLVDFRKDAPGARSGGDTEMLSSIKDIDFNDPTQYGDLISQIEAADYITPKNKTATKENGVEAKQKLLQKVNNNLFSMVSKMPIGEDITAAQDLIKQAVDNVNIERYRYGAVSDKQLGAEKELNVNHVIQGLNFLKYQNPAKYKNVMRGITQKGKIASDDFKELGMVGQSMANDQTYDASAFTPELIGKETNIDYTSDRDKLNDAKIKIGETLKAAGIENVREFSEKQIRTAAKAHPEITEGTLRDIIKEEKKLFKDAIPKSGAIEAIYRGVAQPIEGIISTGKSIVESPAETYLRSKNENIGKKRLPSDKGNWWYDMLEGLGQFVPQVLLTKGIGTPLAGVASSAARTVPLGALTAGQAANISLYGGTGASVFLQSYGDAYADALQKTGDPATAKLIGTIDGISTAAWEMMLPDAKIADDIFKGFKQGLSRDLLSLARRGADPSDLARMARPFVQKFVNNTLKVWGKETAEEVGTQITDFITESIFSPKTAKDRNVIEEAVDTAKSAAVATFLPSVLGGAGVSMQKDLTVDGLHDAAVNLEEYKSSLDRALINDQIDQGSYDNLIRLLETHRQSIDNAPAQDVNGNRIKEKDYLEYAYQNTVSQFNQQRLEEQRQSNPDQILLEPIERTIRDAEEVKRKIYNPTTSATPEESTQTTEDRTDIQNEEQTPEALEPDEYTIDAKNNFWFVRDKNGAIMSVHNTNEEAQNELTRLNEQKGKPSSEQLTQQESAAIEGFKGKQYPQSVKIWTDILQDDNATIEQKKQALRELSDQLTAPGTEATVGEALGKDADLIYDLGYPAVQESESLQELTQPENEIEQTNIESTQPTEAGETIQDDTTVSEEVAPPPAAPTTPEEAPIATTEDDMTGITHAQMDETAREFGMETYEQDPETVEQWDAEANERINKNPNAINNLLEKLRKGGMPDAVEQRMMIRYIASLKARLRANPTTDLLREFNRAKNLSNIVGGRLVAKSLRARQANVPVEDSLAQFLSDEAESQGLETLRQDDIDEATEEYERLQELKKEYERGYEAARQEAAQQQARRGFEEQKNRKDKRKVDKEKNVQDIKDAVEKAREKLKKLRSGESGLSAVPLPGIRELIAIAPEVKKVFQALATEAIQAGKAKFEDVIARVHEYFKDELNVTEQDIIDIVAGEHDERKPTRNDISAELYVLRRIAKLKVELEKLKNGVDPKEKSAKAAKDKRIEELEKQIKDERAKLKDQGQTDQDYLNQRAASIEKRIKELEEKIKNKDYSEPIPPIRPRLDRRTRDLQDRLIELQAMIARRRAKAEYDRMSKVRKGWDTLMQTLGIRRMLQTGIDVSMAGRQAVTSTLNPFAYKRTSKAMYDMFSSLWSPKNFRRNLYNLKESDIGREFTEFGGQFSEPEQMELDKREEEFRTNFVHRFLNKDNTASRVLNRVWFSERAAAGYLNMLRIEHYKSLKTALEKAGVTPENNKEAYEAAAKWVMNSSGRGNMLKLIEDSKSGRVAANNIFFGARLMASRMNMLNPIYYGKMPKEIRVEAIKDMAGFVSGLVTVGAVLAAAGGKVSFDPDDPDFMKVRFGEQTYDLTGGMAVYVRTFLRMTKMAYKGVDPNTSQKDTKKYAKFAGSSLFRSLFENKLAPNTAYLYHFFTQRGGGGGDFDPYEILNYYPLWVNDVKTAYQNDGPTSLMTVLIPSIFGFGTQAYPEKKGFTSEQTKDPAFKYFLDKGMELPNVDENRIKELKDADEDKIEEYRKAHAENLKKELKEVLDKGYVYVNEEGNVRIDKEDGFTKKNVDDLTEEEMASVLSNAQRRATVETKETMFSKKKKNKF